jgi:sterol 3beta-glucosyltransferase
LKPSPDWPEWYVQTGWWRLPCKKAPDPRLREFIRTGPPPLYIGFGSWEVHDKSAATDVILEALRITGNRAVLMRDTVDGRSEYPPDILVAEDPPHEWLFPRVKAAVHHGGAGTTGAAAMAGIPSIIIPAFAAQEPWGRLVAEKRIGTMRKRQDLPADALASAIREVERPEIRERARVLGVLLRSEGGLEQAADEVERRLWEATKGTRLQPVLKLAEVHPVFTSNAYVESLPSPDPLEPRRIAGGDSVPEDPGEGG